MDITKHTVSFVENFEEAYKSFWREKKIVEEKFSSKASRVKAIVELVESFYVEENKYTENLSQIQRQIVLDFIYIIKKLCDIFFSNNNHSISKDELARQLNKKIDEKNNGLAITFRRNIDKIIELITNSHFENLTIKEIDIIEDALYGLKNNNDLEYNIKMLLVEIDFFIITYSNIEQNSNALNNKDEKIPKDILVILQENLGLLNRSNDREFISQTKQIIRYLMANGIMVIWPEMSEINETTNEFFVCKDSEIEQAIIFKPCLKWDEGILKGEVNIPVTNNE